MFVESPITFLQTLCHKGGAIPIPLWSAEFGVSTPEFPLAHSASSEMLQIILHMEFQPSIQNRPEQYYTETLLNSLDGLERH